MEKSPPSTSSAKKPGMNRVKTVEKVAGRIVFQSIIRRNYVVCLCFHRENMINLITRMYQYSVESNVFHGYFMIKSVQVFYGENMINQITRQSPY